MRVAMSEINWGRVLFLSILGFMLVMMVTVGVSSAASVWDSRDPEVQRAQGAGEGVGGRGGAGGEVGFGGRPPGCPVPFFRTGSIIGGMRSFVKIVGIVL